MHQDAGIIIKNIIFVSHRKLNIILYSPIRTMQNHDDPRYPGWCSKKHGWKIPQPHDDSCSAGYSDGPGPAIW